MEGLQLPQALALWNRSLEQILTEEMRPANSRAPAVLDLPISVDVPMRSRLAKEPSFQGDGRGITSCRKISGARNEIQA